LEPPNAYHTPFILCNCLLFASHCPPLPALVVAGYCLLSPTVVQFPLPIAPLMLHWLIFQTQNMNKGKLTEDKHKSLLT
jgi:hypothetical protein